MEGLLKLSEWLEDSGCTHVAMEATGVYWKPVWHVLEESFELVLANAAHVKNVPGRKTDVNDATWLADLHAHGLIRASFVPEQPSALVGIDPGLLAKTDPPDVVAGAALLRSPPRGRATARPSRRAGRRPSGLAGRAG
jgi:hypothetical protein